MFTLNGSRSLSHLSSSRSRHPPARPHRGFRHRRPASRSALFRLSRTRTKRSLFTPRRGRQHSPHGRPSSRPSARQRPGRGSPASRNAWPSGVSGRRRFGERRLRRRHSGGPKSFDDASAKQRRLRRNVDGQSSGPGRCQTCIARLLHRRAREAASPKASNAWLTGISFSRLLSCALPLLLRFLRGSPDFFRRAALDDRWAAARRLRWPTRIVALLRRPSDVRRNQSRPPVFLVFHFRGVTAQSPIFHDSDQTL